jgi:hypothetical protein
MSINSLQSSVASQASKDNVARFQAASLWRARWQVINSFGPYVLLWFAMDRALSVSYWLMLPIFHYLSRLRPRVVLQIQARQ